MNIARARADLPPGALAAFDGQISAASFRVETALQAAQVNVAGASLHINIGLRVLLDADIAAARAGSHRAGNIAGFNISRSGVQANFSIQVV